jgi:tetratricopeptide (TPR) repeat protein
MNAESKLVHCTSEPPPAAQPPWHAAVDATFPIALTSRLQIEAGIPAEDLIEHLARAVARNPRDLRSHARRIYACRRHRDKECLTGALLDLFIGLGDKGLALRRRLLSETAFLLDRELRGFFVEHLEPGLDARDALPSARMCLHGKGYEGDRHLLEETGAGPATEVGEALRRDLFREARDAMEYGQVDLARTLLEEAILLEPKRPEIHHDLLEIYRYTKDRKRLITMREQLESIDNPFPEHWEEALAAMEEAENNGG